MCKVGSFVRARQNIQKGVVDIYKIEISLTCSCLYRVRASDPRRLARGTIARMTCAFHDLSIRARHCRRCQDVVCAENASTSLKPREESPASAAPSARQTDAWPGAAAVSCALLAGTTEGAGQIIVRRLVWHLLAMLVSGLGAPAGVPVDNHHCDRGHRHTVFPCAPDRYSHPRN